MVDAVFGKSQVTAFVTVVEIEGGGDLPVTQRFGRIVAMWPEKAGVFRVITTDSEFFECPFLVESMNMFDFR